MERSDPSAAAVPGLPDDALVEILLLLPIKPLRKSKCVSKGWRDLIADPLHQKKLPQTLEGFFYGGGDARTDEYIGGYTGRRKPAGYGHFINPLGAPAAAIVDPSFAFLKEVPGITNIRLVGSCNGLLLFEHDVDVERRIVRYIVCNPATEELVTIPVDWTPESVEPWWRDSGRIYLIFCPDISSHFHIVKLWEKMTSIEPNLLVHVYSSETKAWSCRLCVWSDRYIVESGFVIAGLGSAFVNGMLYLHAFFDDSEELVVATNLEGNQWKIIPAPLRVGDEDTYYTHYVGPSQGRLHYIYHAHADDVEQECDAGGVPSELSSNFNTSNFDDWGGNIKEVLLIWVLEDYDTERWVLKHTVSFLELFGKKVIPMDYRYSVVAIHPDCNLVFIVQHWNQKLISYNMDSREVCDLCTLPHDYGKITPYVPYFSKLASLENKQ